jgi:hypothetical protein
VPQINLDNDEAATLRDVLQDYISDLRMEIAGTDAMDFREELKAREAVLKRLLAQLGPG